MMTTKNAPAAGTTGAKDNRNYGQVNCGHLYFTTWLMAFTTIIAGWHITDVWTGIVTALCGLVTIVLVNEIIGGQR